MKGKFQTEAEEWVRTGKTMVMKGIEREAEGIKKEVG